MSILPDMGLPNVMTENDYAALPDVVVYRCKEDRNAKPEASDVLLMVEVSSPSTEREDLVDKMAQYAASGIPFPFKVTVAFEELTE